MANVCFRSYNGNYVCAERGGGRELTATRTRPAEWETFGVNVVDVGASRVTLRAYNGQYVCAEGGGGGSRTPDIGLG